MFVFVNSDFPDLIYVIGFRSLGFGFGNYGFSSCVQAFEKR